MTTLPTAYMRTVLGPREEILDEILRDALLEHGLRPMQIDDNAARVLQLLTLIRRPQKVIEVGTFFGYSSIHIARGLPDGGRLTSLEIDNELAGLARHNLERAGLSDRVNIVMGTAADYLTTVELKSIDMIFIDADKISYPEYLKLSFPLLKDGGLLIADDAFLHGDFSTEAEDDNSSDKAVNAISTYSRAVGKSPRLFSAFIGTKNGLLVSYKD